MGVAKEKAVRKRGKRGLPKLKDRDWSSFGGRLRWARIAKCGYSTEQVMEAVSGASSLSRYENNERDAPLPVVVDLARHLKVSVRWLATGEGLPSDARDISYLLFERRVKELPVALQKALVEADVRLSTVVAAISDPTHMSMDAPAPEGGWEQWIADLESGAAIVKGKKKDIATAIDDLSQVHED